MEILGNDGVKKILNLLKAKLEKYSLSTHLHDDRYTTLNTVQSLLNNKSDTSHTHDYGMLTNKCFYKPDPNASYGQMDVTSSPGAGILLNHDAGALAIHSFTSAGTYPTYKDLRNYMALFPNGMATVNQLDSALYMGVADTSSSFFIWSRRDNSYYLGTASRRFNALYAATATIQTSDRNKKNSIIELNDDKTKQFILGLKPSSYKLNDGKSGRTHYGLIAQDVEELMNNLEMSSLDFAGFIKSPRVEATQDPENPSVNFETKEGEFDYSLRYEEFIAPLIKMVQIQQKEIDELRTRVSKLEENQRI